MQLADLGGDLRAHFDAALEGTSDLELTILAYDWEGWWLRPEQVKPEGKFRSWGAVTGRGWGKTVANAVYVHREAMSGRAMRIGIIAQNDDETRDVMVDGETGLIAVAPPWEQPVMVRGKLRWPNGATASLFTPEVPGDIRGPGFHLFWCTEFCVWPATRDRHSGRPKREEAWNNVKLTTRLGYARIVWDSTPKRRHPIIRSLLERHRRAPDKHLVVRGSSRDNAANLLPEALEEWYEDMGGTERGREELEGEFIDDDEGALVRIEWIDAHRAPLPPRLDRRVIAIDPAISLRRSTDDTGIVEGGSLNVRRDRIVVPEFYCIADHSGRHDWEGWGRDVVVLWLENEIDCIIVERNRGGDAVAANIRAAARDHGIDVRVVPVKTKITKHNPRLITIKEQVGRRSKLERLEPVAPFYERGRIHHVEDADLAELEEQVTGWEPEEDSPNALDAWVWVMWELAELGVDLRDGRRAMKGLDAARQRLPRRAEPQTVGGRVMRNPSARRRGGVLPRKRGGSRI